MSGIDLSALSIPCVEAVGADDEFFHVTCPSCGALTLASLEEPDGSLCDCDACWLGQYFLYAGRIAAARRRDPC